MTSSFCLRSGVGLTIDEPIPAYAFVATYLLLRAIALFTPLRGSEREEALGMDFVHHGEEAYASGEGAILVPPEEGVEVEAMVADPG